MIFINSESRVNSRLFSVIRGHFFNVIRWLRPANLVTNRSFTSVSLPDVIRQSRSTGQSPWMTVKRSKPSQDTRNKSGNDKCLWRLFSGYKFFNYPSPDTTVSTSPARGKVLNNITFKGFDVVRQYAALLKRRVQSSTRVRKAQAVTRQTNPIGRSMIEMLGVLAIIGVLSVGGIAGYSKAMTKWKTNKTIEQIANFIDGLTTLALNQKQLRGTSDEYPTELGSYEPGDIELFKTLGIIDEEMLVDGELKTPFGGDFWFNGVDNEIDIHIYDLPREACMAIATATWGNGKFDIAVSKGVNSDGSYMTADCHYPVPENNFSEVSEGATLGCYHDGGVPLTPDKAAYGCSCEEASCRIEIYFQKFI